jgi:hypothetical protein
MRNLRRTIRSLSLACLGSLAFAATALANTSAPRSPVTKSLPGVPCSVTATFTLSAGARTMTYGGGVSCAGGVGAKTIDVVPQVFNVVNGKPLWFSISLVGLYQGPTPINPVRLTGATSYVPSHTYRLLVYGKVTMPDGRSSSATVCSACTGSPQLSIGSSYTYNAQPASGIGVPDVPCSLGQNGLVFTLVNNSYVMNYGGFSGCGTRAGRRTLTICAQVVNRINGKDIWFTISGSCLSQGPASSNPLGLSTARTAYLGHGYRIMVGTTVQYPLASGTVTRSATLYSASAAP